MSCNTCGGTRQHPAAPEHPCPECNKPIYWLERILGELEQLNSEPALNALERINLYRVTLGSDTFPIGFQVIRDDCYASLLTISPGLLSWSTAGQNSTSGLRIYRGRFASEQGWVSGYQTSDLNPSELEHEQLCSVCQTIPWERPLTFFVEFSFLNNPPTGSTLRGIIRPFKQ